MNRQERSTTHPFETPIVGLLVVCIFFFAFWRASDNSSIDRTKTNTNEEHMKIENVNNKTIAPGAFQDNSFSNSCMCPQKPGGMIAGKISNSVLLGQHKHEGNSAYTFVDCTSNAQEMVDLLQDQYTFVFGQSITRTPLGQYPPTHLYYTWDQENQSCNFYLDCGGVGECDSKSYGTGVVVRTTKPEMSQKEHMSIEENIGYGFLGTVLMIAGWFLLYGFFWIITRFMK